MHSTLILTLNLMSVSCAFVSKAPNFAVKAKLEPDSPLIAVQGWNLDSYHTSPCYDYAVFSTNPSRIFYANGTDDQFSSHTSNILSDGGTPPWPWGVVVEPANATDSEGRRNVLIDCGAGTPGVEVKTDGSFPMMGQGPRVVYGGGEFYICNTTFEYGPTIALYFRESEDDTPAGCSDVELQTFCLADETEHDFQEDSWCYNSTMVA